MKPAVIIVILVICGAGALLTVFRFAASRPVSPSREPKDIAIQPESAARSLEASRSTPRPMVEVSDPRIRRLANSSLPVEQRISSDISAKIPSVSDSADCKALANVLMDATDDDTVRNEVANLLRRSAYLGLADALLVVLDNPAEKARFRSFAVQHLAATDSRGDVDKREMVRSKLISLVQDRDVEVRREALLALCRQHEPIGVETAVKLLSSSARGKEEVRDLAIRCVSDLGLREHIPAIRKCLSDEDAIVRIAAIVALSEWGDIESRTAFEEASKSSNVRIQRAGKLALDRLNSLQKPPEK